MILYIFYRVGRFMALRLPVTISYKIASIIADIYYLLFPRDREAVIFNVSVVLGKRSTQREIETCAKEIFRNFAKYLVEFFRFSKIDEQFIDRYVTIKGREYVDAALSRGHGVILLSAHLGNWELGGMLMSLLGYDVSAVVLPHDNSKINGFFEKQRMLGGIRPINIGFSIRSCFDVLKSNRVLALLGDRDFTANGVAVNFFGRLARLPKGPAALSTKLGAAIVPSYLLRNGDGKFELIFYPPIFPNNDNASVDTAEKLTERCAAVMEECVKKYPSQWYVFKKFWDDNE